MTGAKAIPRLFDNRLSREWIGFTILRRVIIAIAIVHFSLAAISGYRAIVQVYRASITTDGHTLREGSLISADVVTAGRTYVAVTVTLEQKGKSAVLEQATVPGNESFFYDFRSKRAHFDIAVTRELLKRFEPGPATIRVAAEGRAQWLRVPPPKSDRVSVILQ